MPARGSSWRTSASGSPPATRSAWSGRNGAGKTTLTKILAGEALPASGLGAGHRRGRLPARRTRASATPRCSPATGSSPRAASTTSYAACARPRPRWAATTRDVRERAMTPLRARRRRAARRRRVRRRVRGRARSPAASASRSGSSAQPLKTLSGGQRRRVELARILFSGADTLLLDEPTNHLDADSIVWLREFLKAHKGGLIVISHDNELLEATVNKVLHLDANRGRDRRLQHGLEGLPAPSARPTSSAASASGRTPRTRPRRSPTRPTRCAPRPPRPRPRSRCSSAPRR